MKYKVDVLEVQGINKRVHVAGDVVTDKHFPEGVAAQLEKKGYLKPIGKKENEKELKAAEKKLAESTKGYEEVQRLVKEIEDEIKEESAKKDKADQKILDNLNVELKEAQADLQTAEKELNTAKANVKKLQE
jgi:hypothetical protein